MATSHVDPQVSAVPPWAVQQRIGTAAARYALNSMVMPRTDSGLTYTDYRSGVMASGDGGDEHLAMQVTPAGGMSVTVAQGNAIINTPNQGAYMCCLDAEKTLTIPASSSSNYRVDLVVAAVYDDNNSAIAGEPDTRQFTVEIVQGDPSTGNPVVPEVPMGVIALAQVRVDRNTRVITEEMLTDRRGPGLTARGGMRALYGTDATQDSEEFRRPGAYPGDQRWVHTNSFQHQVYYGEPPEAEPLRGGWRGVFNCLVFNNSPTSGDYLWAMSYASGWREFTRVHIPYPGTPYMIYPSARVHCKLSVLTAAEAMITNGTMPGGTIFSWSGLDIGTGIQTSQAPDTTQTINIAPIMWGPFDDALDVVLSGHVITSVRSGGGGIGANATSRTVLSVLVFPSTVAPPGEGSQAGGQVQNPGVDGSVGADPNALA